MDNLNQDYKWKTNFGVEGGIHLVEIPPNDPDYCIDCIYYGFIESITAGSVQIFVSIEHLNHPMLLTGGQTYPEILRGKEYKIYQFYNGDQDQFSIAITVQTGMLRIYVGSSKNVGENEHLMMKDFGNEEKYEYIIVKPSSFPENKSGTFYFRIQETKNQKSAFILTVIKNSLKQQLEIGLPKQIGVGPKESAEFFFQKQVNSQTYNFDLEIVSMNDVDLFRQAKLHLTEFVELHQSLPEKGKVKLPIKYEAHDEGRLRVKFDITDKASQNYYTIQIYNSIDTFIRFNAILTENYFKFLNLDENTVEVVEKGKYRIFEVIASKNQQLYFDVK